MRGCVTVDDIFWIFTTKPTLEEASTYLEFGGNYTHSLIDDLIEESRELGAIAADFRVWNLRKLILEYYDFLDSWDEFLYAFIAYLNEVGYKSNYVVKADVSLITDLFNRCRMPQDAERIPIDVTFPYGTLHDLVYYYSGLSFDMDLIRYYERNAPGLIFHLDLSRHWKTFRERSNFIMNVSEFFFAKELEEIHQSATWMTPETFKKTLELYPRDAVQALRQHPDEKGIFEQTLGNSAKVKMFI